MKRFHSLLCLGAASLFLSLWAGCAPLPVCVHYSAPLCHDVGVHYEKGSVGYDQSKEQARAHYGVACARGLQRSCRAGCNLEGADSCNRLGLQIVRRRAHKHWRKAARTAFTKACELGSAGGCGNVAQHMLKGRRSAERLAVAKGYMQRACDGGHERACADLLRWKQPVATPPEKALEPAQPGSPDPSPPADPTPKEAPAVEPAPQGSPACGEAREDTWVGFGGVEMLWCGDEFILRTLDGQEKFRLRSGSLGTDEWAQVGEGRKAVCVDFLSGRLGQENAGKARCFAIKNEGQLPAVSTSGESTSARFEGDVWRINAQGGIERQGVPVLSHAKNRFALTQSATPQE